MIQDKLSIGTDIGGTHIACAAVRIADGHLLEHSYARVPCDHTAPAADILKRWAEALNSTFSQIKDAPPAGIGFAIPGPFDYRNGISKMRHKFPRLYDVRIPEALKPLLNIGYDLPMRFLNDATAFAAGEAWLGEGRNARKVVVVTLGTGFGSAFMDDGVPVVQGDNVPKEGCLWHLPFRDGIADEYFSTGWFVREWEKRSGEKIAGVKALMEKAGADDHARGLFAEFGANLAECLSPWLRSFRAEVLVVGGNIAHALPLFGDSFGDALRESGIDVRVAASTLLETAALLGSARLLDDAYWEKVSAQLPAL